MNRRRFLKNCSLVPLLAFPIPSLIGCFNERVKPTDVFLFLHGLMFMEFDKDKKILTVTAPDIHDHKYSFLSLMPGETANQALLRPMFRYLDWTKGELGGAEKLDSFPPAIPQFSASNTGVGKTKAVGHRFQMVLPVPLEIIAFRIVSPNIVLKGKVGKEIKDNNQEKPFALVTCLRYTNKGGIHLKHHFYAEPAQCSTNDLDHANHAFESAKILFEHPEKFDLLIDTCTNCCKEPAAPPITGGSREDSFHLCEVMEAKGITCWMSFTGGPLCSTIAVTP